jgi:hypothetical protein
MGYCPPHALPGGGFEYRQPRYALKVGLGLALWDAWLGSACGPAMFLLCGGTPSIPLPAGVGSRLASEPFRAPSAVRGHGTCIPVLMRSVQLVFIHSVQSRVKCSCAGARTVCGQHSCAHARCEVERSVRLCPWHAAKQVAPGQLVECDFNPAKGKAGAGLAPGSDGETLSPRRGSSTGAGASAGGKSSWEDEEDEDAFLDCLLQVL